MLSNKAVTVCQSYWTTTQKKQDRYMSRIFFSLEQSIYHHGDYQRFVYIVPLFSIQVTKNLKILLLSTSCNY
jgi:hypothetical protein